MSSLPATGQTAYLNAATQPQPFNTAFNMDGAYWGVLVSTMLLGITFSQGWMYASSNGNRDSWRLRVFVALVILMDFAITCVTWQVLYFYLVSNFGNPLVFLTTPRPWVVAMILMSTVVAMTEVFFASRIYLLNNSLWSPLLTCLLAAGGFVCFILAVHSNLVHASVSELPMLYEKNLLGIGVGFNLCTILVITVVLVTRLTTAHTNVQSTKSVVQRLLIFFVSRGLLVTLNELAFLVVYEANGPASMDWVPFLLMAPKLHIITMMAILNSRRSSTASQAASTVTSFTESSNTRPINFSSTKRSSNSPSISPNTPVPPVIRLPTLTDKAQRYGNAYEMGERRILCSGCQRTF